MVLQDYEQAVILAHVAERAERYDEMKGYMKERAEKGGPLSGEERDLFSAAFKGALNGRRLAVRVSAGVEAQERQDGNEARANLAAGFRSKVEVELQEVCVEAIDLLKNKLSPNAEPGEARTFYLKMKGDYHRYLAEFARSSERAVAKEEATIAYNAAMEEAAAHLATTHPVRLGLSLNFSVFQHEVLEQTSVAIETAEKAKGAAESDFKSLPEDAQRDALLTMQLLEDNLQLWKN